MNLLLTAAAGAATYTVPSFSSASIQATINAAYSAGSNNTVLLPAGSYTISSPISVPCNNGLTISGPTTTPATAVLNATFNSSSIFNLSGCNGVTIEYLQFVNSGAIYADNTNHSNITVTHSQFYGLPSAINGGSDASAAIFLDGSINTTITNFTATWNTFGDSNSCTAVFATAVDEGGYCAGIYAQPGVLVNPLVQYNVFNHVEEGVHYHQIVDGTAPKGTLESVTQNSIVQFNYFINWHRIAIEMQGGVIGSSQVISDNSLQQPLNPSYGTMFISEACCTGGRTYLNSGPADAPNVTENNLMWTDSPQQVGSFWAPVIGIEFWGGADSRANGNYAMGNFPNQIDWGFGAQPWYVENNYLCGAHSGAYISDEEGSATPTYINNTTVGSCTQQKSAAATISPAGGTFSSAPTVTLTTSGRNTSIYYTTDGTTPVPGSGTAKLYTGSFTVNLPATVQAVGMWGVPPQPTSYPAPYGFSPSAVASASYTSTSGTRTVAALTGVTIAGAGGQQSLAPGATLQMTATCAYSDGSTTNCTTTDSHGNGSAWTSSNGSVTVSATGLATAVSAGSSSITGTVAGVTAAAWTITVTPPVVTLTSVSLSNPSSVHSLTKGMAIQMTATCGYSDGSTTNCTVADSHSNGVSAWTSSSSGTVTVSATGMATAAAAGSTNLTATVAGLTTTVWPFTVITPALSLVTLNTTGAAASLTTGTVNQLVATCQYSDGSSTNCTTTDTNGSVATPWTSSMPTVASVSSAGMVTAVTAGSTNLTTTVTPTTATQWGATSYDQLGYTYPGWINATYTTLGTQPGGYTSGTCSFYLPAGTLTVGSQYDCGLVPAPTPTTQSAAWQCWYTYTVTNASWAGGWVTGPMSDCGNLAAGSSWWVSLVTNQPGQSPAGFYDCGNTCSGAAPTNGSGTYGYAYIADTYGTHTGMTTTMNAGPARQAAQYVTLGQPSMVSNTVALMVTPATPTLSSIYITSLNNASTIVKGGTLQFTAWGVYSNGSVQKLPDAQGDTVGLWNTSNHAIAKVSTLGHVTAISTGTVNIMAYVGSVAAPVKTITVTAAPSKSPSTTANAEETSSANPTPGAPAAPVADPFTGPLWSLTAPAGGSASISPGHLFLGVPGGSNHDASSGQDNVVRVVQPIGDESFDVSLGIDSSLSATDAGTSQGLLVVGDDQNYVTYSLDTDGTKIGLSLVTVSNGAIVTVLKDSDLAHYQNPMYLRVTRNGSGYVAFYSTDGQNWLQAASFNFTTTPTAIGPFAANHTDTPSDAVPVVMSVNSFVAR